MEIANKPENLIQLTAVEELTGKSMKTLISLAESEKTPMYATLGIGSGVPAVPIALETSKGASARLAIRHHKSTADERGLEVSNLPKGVRQVAQQILILGNHFIQIHPDNFRELLEVTDYRQIQIHYVLLTLDFWEPKSKAEVERLLEVSATEESRELLLWFRRPVTLKLSNLYIPKTDHERWKKTFLEPNKKKRNLKKTPLLKSEILLLKLMDEYEKEKGGTYARANYVWGRLTEIARSNKMISEINDIFVRFDDRGMAISKGSSFSTTLYNLRKKQEDLNG